jgi:hypothetical protein
MADDFSDPFRYGLGDLPMEPPDTFNGSYPVSRPTPMGMPPGALPVVQAGFGMRLPRRLPPGPFEVPGQQTPPIRMPQIPEWWKLIGSAIQILPSIVTGTFGANGRYDDPECQKEWGEALDFCAKELAKPNPSNLIGGHTSIEDCARGLVSEPCGGNPKDYGDQPSKTRRR